MAYWTSLSTFAASSRYASPTMGAAERFTGLSIAITIQITVSLGQELLSATPGANALASVFARADGASHIAPFSPPVVPRECDS